MNEYIKRETIKTAWLETAKEIISRADDEEQDIVKRHTQRHWDFGVHALVEEMSEEGKEALWYLRMRQNNERAGALMLYKRLADLPAADVAPIVHAHWKCPTANPTISNRDFFSDCSNCGITKMDETDYCPACGARMDEEADE